MTATPKTVELNYVRAVEAALDDALDLWPECVVFGEDVAESGSVFGSTRSLHMKHGSRIFDTPISESAILGAAFGASILGTPQDACDILLTAIGSDDPLVLIEHRALYFGALASVTRHSTPRTPGGAAHVRTGSDVSVVVWGMMVTRVLEAADRLTADGIEVDVIGLRWLKPLDWDSIGASLERTGKLAIVHETNRTGGFGAEIAARAANEEFDLLDAPVICIAVPDTPMPAAPHLRDVLLPSVESIERPVRSLVRH